MNTSLINGVKPYIETAKQQKTTEKQTKIASLSPPKMSEQEKNILEHAEKTWENYMTTSEGKSFVESLKQMPLEVLEVTLLQKLESPLFKETRSLAKESDDNKSFSIGISFLGGVILGGSITVGAAMGIGAYKENMAATFLSVGFDAGFIVDADIAFQFGLWRDIPEDLKGGYYAHNGSIAVGIELGVGFVYSTKTEDFIGYTFTLGVGLGVAIDGEIGYTYTRKPIYQPRNNSLVVLKKIHCKESSTDGPGNEDEVFFTFKADDGVKYRYPTHSYFSMKENHHDNNGTDNNWYCGRSVWCDDEIHFKLYDYDGVRAKDKLGDIHIKVEDLTLNVPRTYSLVSDAHHDKYRMEVELVYTKKYYRH